MAPQGPCRGSALGAACPFRTSILYELLNPESSSLIVPHILPLPLPPHARNPAQGAAPCTTRKCQPENLAYAKIQNCHLTTTTSCMCNPCRERRAMGYAVVAVEQASDSVPLHAYAFPRK